MDEAAVQKRAEQAARDNNLNNLQGELNVNLDDGIAGIARDTYNESPFNPDDFVVVKNIFDGEEKRGFQFPSLKYEFEFNGRRYRVNPGQTFTLNGATAYVFLKHVVSLIYRRIANDPENDRRTYPMDDPWVKLIVVEVRRTLAAEDDDSNETIVIPDYVQNDENLSKTIGGGESVESVQYDDAEISDKDFDKTPDFTPANNPNLDFNEKGEVLDGKKQGKVAKTAAVKDAPPTEFPDAKKS